MPDTQGNNKKNPVAQPLTQKEKEDIVHSNLGDVTRQLSTITRTVNFGVLGTLFTLLVTKESALDLAEVGFLGLTIVGAIKISLLLVILSLLADFIQYIVRYRVNKSLLVAVESGSHQGNILYDYKSCAFRWMMFAFGAKIALAFANSAWVLIVLAYTIFL
jgi:hypothetical protein